MTDRDSQSPDRTPGKCSYCGSNVFNLPAHIEKVHPVNNYRGRTDEEVAAEIRAMLRGNPKAALAIIEARMEATDKLMARYEAEERSTATAAPSDAHSVFGVVASNGGRYRLDGSDRPADWDMSRWNRYVDASREALGITPHVPTPVQETNARLRDVLGTDQKAKARAEDLAQVQRLVNDANAVGNPAVQWGLATEVAAVASANPAAVDYLSQAQQDIISARKQARQQAEVDALNAPEPEVSGWYDVNGNLVPKPLTRVEQLEAEIERLKNREQG